MQCKVDWLSFTFPGGEPDNTKANPEWWIALRGLHRELPGFAKMLTCEGQLVDGGGRAPFRKSLRNQEMGVTLFYGHKKNLVLVEISGNGCEKLRSFNGLVYVLQRSQDKATRVDIACDWQTDTKPTQFADCISNNRFKSGGVLHSETGETVYVGSRTSDRYARVYRYNPPHPRSNLLRCEMVFRDDQAKEVVRLLYEEGEHETARKAGATFGWTHELWVGEMGKAEKIASAGVVDRGGGTLRWLYTQVAPALERLMVDGQRGEVETWLAEMAALCYDYSQRSSSAHDR